MPHGVRLRRLGSDSSRQPESLGVAKALSPPNPKANTLTKPCELQSYVDSGPRFHIPEYIRDYSIPNYKREPYVDPTWDLGNRNVDSSSCTVNRRIRALWVFIGPPHVWKVSRIPGP